MAAYSSTSCAPNLQLKNVLLLFLFSYTNFEVCAHNDYPFWNASLSWDDRLDDLLGRLLLDDMVRMMARGGANKNSSPAIKHNPDNLGIQPYNWNTECLRGDALAGNATSFPQALGLAAAFR